jgi:hypothetical protein
LHIGRIKRGRFLAFRDLVERGLAFYASKLISKGGGKKKKDIEMVGKKRV